MRLIQKNKMNTMNNLIRYVCPYLRQIGYIVFFRSSSKMQKRGCKAKRKHTRLYLFLLKRKQNYMTEICWIESMNTIKINFNIRHFIRELEEKINAIKLEQIMESSSQSVHPQVVSALSSAVQSFPNVFLKPLQKIAAVQAVLAAQITPVQFYILKLLLKHNQHRNICSYFYICYFSIESIIIQKQKEKNKYFQLI
ncbi:unnamed protein product [Paramecium sonneborni]|uniref:Uncharacterized protein n=1 Tax=Paramecium sonneborni TaxID=65129 RepID=A0A8S1RMS3_9CILI|nr:unnamed protein product [Paramecium sonneborni]